MFRRGIRGSWFGAQRFIIYVHYYDEDSRNGLPLSVIGHTQSLRGVLLLCLTL